MQADEGAARDMLLLRLACELRTPCTNAIGFLELVTNPAIGTLNDKQTEYLRDVMASVVALTEIIDDVQALMALQGNKTLH